MQKCRVAVIDSHGLAIGKLHNMLTAEGYACHQIKVDTLTDSRPLAGLPLPDLVILVSAMETVHEIISEVKRTLRKTGPVPVVLISKYGSESLAVSAFRAGVSDYFNADFSSRDLLDGLKKHMSSQPQPSPPQIPSNGVTASVSAHIVGNSFAMRTIKEKLSRFAATDYTVMITGETGTGKELAARWIYENSPRKKGAFVCLNCAALPESLVESELFGYEKGAFTGAVSSKKGKFEQASGGTLFLDEIGEMTPLAQAKILRAIENKTVYPLNSRAPVRLDVRLIAATNQDFEQLVADRKFRKDLYYRLNVAQVSLPPLRERKEDIPGLVDSEMKQLNRRFNRNVTGMAGEAMASFFFHDWPGNIRELKNVIQVAYVNCTSKKIQFSDLPDALTKKLKFTPNKFANDRDMLLAALSVTRWNKSKAAKKLNWSRMRVYRTLERYRIV